MQQVSNVALYLSLLGWVTIINENNVTKML
jgi:hypothetical protein